MAEITPFSLASHADVSMRVGRVAAPLREQVVDVLREAILDFRLKPGQRLIERELIEQTGVSRTTIREVLRQLATEGLVTTIPQKGAIVVMPSQEEAAELYEVRTVLESAAIKRFIEHASPANVRALRKALERLERVCADDDADVRAVLKARDEFYDVLLDGAGNRSIHEILSGLQARLRLLSASSFSQPGRPAASAAELRKLVEAIEAGDVELAVAVSQQHLDHAAKTGIDAIAVLERPAER